MGQRLKILIKTFILFLGFTFATITLLTPPSQGWYCWFLPLFIYFLIKNELETAKLFYWIFICAYFIYFLVIPESFFQFDTKF